MKTEPDTYKMVIQKQTKIVHPGGFDGGVVRVPGDKSISHRTALLAGISSGTSEIRGFLQAFSDAAEIGERADFLPLLALCENRLDRCWA